MNLIDLVFPRKCLECGKTGSYICDCCLLKVGKPKPVCIQCEKASIDGMTHARCKRKLTIDYNYSGWKYGGVIRKGILKLKYNFAYELAEDLAEKFVSDLQNSSNILPREGILIPIPLHRLRQNWRGYNQSIEIGKLIAAKMDWKFIPDLLLRKKISRPQTELKEEERMDNIRNIFSFNPNYLLLSTFQARGLSRPEANYILFDDVMTTGSTLKEAGKVLKRHGANIVWGLTLPK